MNIQKVFHAFETAMPESEVENPFRDYRTDARQVFQLTSVRSVEV